MRRISAWLTLWLSRGAGGGSASAGVLGLVYGVLQFLRQSANVLCLFAQWQSLQMGFV